MSVFKKKNGALKAGVGVPAVALVKKKNKAPKKAEKDIIVKTKDGYFVNTDHKDYERREGETQQAYNERVPIQFQPLVEVGAVDYLGRKRK